MTAGELKDWLTHNVTDDTPVFLEIGHEVFVGASHCVADETGVILYQDLQEEETEDDSTGIEG